MKKALRIVFLLVLVTGVASACACPRRTMTPEALRGGEKATVEAGIEALMNDKGITDLSKYADGTPTGAPVRSYNAGEATNDMAVFPSTVWHLYRDYNEGTTLIFRLPTTEYYYTVENDGTVRQFGDPAKTVEYNAGG
jgi:hypothetical protein